MRLLGRFPDLPLGVIRATESQLGGDFSEPARRSYETDRQRWRHINFLSRYDFSVSEPVAWANSGLHGTLIPNTTFEKPYDSRPSQSAARPGTENEANCGKKTEAEGTTTDLAVAAVGREDQLEELAKDLADDLAAVIEDLVDIEEYARAGRPVPRARRYRYRVNKQHLVTECPELTGRQILESAGLVPVEQYRLRLKERHGPPVEIGLDQVVDLRKPGVERFVAQKKEVQDGLEARRHFALPAEDSAFLDSLGLRWEAIAEGGNFWVVIYGVPLPPGFTQSETDVAIQIMPGYPTSQLDMAYFHPPVLAQDRRAIAYADVSQNLDERTWQRWSRHRIGATAWVPGEDNLERHFMFMQDWWSRELKL